MGANGIDIGSGFTTPDIEEGLIKETAINKSYMAFVLADHSKFRRVYSVTFAPLQKCCIITDKLPTPALIFMLILEIPLSSLIKSVIILSLRIPFSMASRKACKNVV